MTNHRPFAARARELCPESDEHHARVWFCTMCRVLEMRLTPVSEVLRDLLDDADLTITVDVAAANEAIRKALAESLHRTPKNLP